MTQPDAGASIIFHAGSIVVHNNVGYMPEAVDKTPLNVELVMKF